MSFFTRASTAVSNEIADVADVEEEGPSSFEDPLPFFTLCSDHAGPHPSLLPCLYAPGSSRRMSSASEYTGFLHNLGMAI